ncbi:MAG: hypothetical protein V7739_15075 [Motiliproteus sp.]
MSKRWPQWRYHRLRFITFSTLGSAFTTVMSIFISAGIRLIPFVHGLGVGRMACCARISGRHGVCIAQNGLATTRLIIYIFASFWRAAVMLGLNRLSEFCIGRRPFSALITSF